jgi:tetratricopeptide (TPR) repeat protein
MGRGEMVRPEMVRPEMGRGEMVRPEMGRPETERPETERGARVLAIFAAAAIAASGWQPTGAQLVNTGRFAEALAAFEGALRTDPKSVAANNGAGVALDLLGRYAEAQPYFTAAIKASHTPLEKALAERAMAIGYGFAGDCADAEKPEKRAFDFYVETLDFPNAGDVADELGRLCLDAGDFDRAAEWYQKGHDEGELEPKISPARTDLWEFRLAHAKGRIAARRGKIAEARKQAQKARAILDRGRIPDQEEFFPYLEGYIAFYASDYAEALNGLNRASGADSFIQCLTGQTYEALGDRAHAIEFYQKAAAATAHSVPAAYAQPFARRKLAAWNLIQQ